MKLMFVSDIHGSLPAAEQVLSLFAQHGAQWLVILGDILNHGPRNALPPGYAPSQVAELLNTQAEKIIAVKGNCDSEVDQMLLHFPLASPCQQVLLPQRRIFLTHGHLWHDEKLPSLTAGDVLAYGHSHLPLAELREEIYHFNPGSVSIPKGGFAASYGLLEDNELSVMTLHSPRVITQVTLTL